MPLLLKSNIDLEVGLSTSQRYTNYIHLKSAYFRLTGPCCQTQNFEDVILTYFSLGNITFCVVKPIARCH